MKIHFSWVKFTLTHATFYITAGHSKLLRKVTKFIFLFIERNVGRNCIKSWSCGPVFNFLQGFTSVKPK